MPTYCYQAKEEKGCSLCQEGFEIVQSMKDDPMEKCPDCGKAVLRVVQAPYINRRKSTKSLLSDDNIKKHGFTKLVNEGGGKFRKL